MYSLIFLVFLLVQTKAELFTSSAHLQTALYAERDIADLLKSYIQREEDRLSRIKQLAEDYEEHSKLALQNLDKYLGNPINAFLLIKRFTLDWDRDVIPVLVNNSWDSMYKEIEQVRSDLPSHEDLKGAASALMRLQDTYQLDTSKVAQGDLRGIVSPVLSAEECFELGRLSYNQGDYYHTMLWMEQAWDKQEKAGGEGSKDFLEDLEDAKVEILDYLAFSYYKLGDVAQALELTKELLTLDPNHERALNNKKYFEAMLRDEPRKTRSAEEKPGYQLNRDEYRNSEEFLTYEALCRGETTMPLKNAHLLTCRYVTNNHPLLLIQPIKEETVHLDPWIVVYYNVMSDEEISTIKHLATPRLNRATVQNSKTGALETANYRISKSAWLRGEEHPVVERLNQRMEAITGLDLNTAEELQIANYGLGGHYEPHFDYARKEEKDAFKSLGTGNRIATFLNYMSDVEAGGATVFPYLGLKLFPRKGNAAFWYNLYKSGEGIFNTRHAACPVLVGSKWVANKWIHERGQEFRRPCSLSEYE
ncbi:prolyl 4-hydroxylase subunit alpha-1-like isoform X4 [Biomphalaria glabrata]|nr:prolyl 4-hydroxylase subunit alpha-1-like isoform X4 [Biomphalaria glabrata]XP_055875551.1 prolyl 4-hydroxylase subunit alpha-1-like isoform X4 [Biomphalaria glabrata]XP_055875552.1 prolyl 4-hydroxylase subunit alpha-1-like isoform X4 [Biomphalaria glabrata]